MVKDFKTGALKTFNFDKLLKHIPEINHLNCKVESISFEEPIDSSNMNISNWVLLAELIEKNYYNFDGFVVLHGSDTMSYTASAISFMFENLTKPIIFTGSQLPIGDLRTDVARQRRGVVEGYQADVLGAVGDIEAKGQFEFGTSPEAMSAVVGDSLSRLRDAAEQRGFNPTQTTMMQPSQEQEDEMQDYYGGDDWDHGQFDMPEDWSI